MLSHKRNFGPQHLVELERQIDDIHEQLLDTDDGDKRSESMRLLRGYAAQYLYLVPHPKKFQFLETSRVLANSVAAFLEFDPREASLAFENLAKYAHNLLEQPWRKEFHKIKLTSGFYIHNIRAHLSNAQELLVLLNYTGTDYSTLTMTTMPDTKRLKAFSKDCLIASQECLILSQIWERFQQQIPDYPFTVQEAFKARSELVGDLETIVKRLLYEAHARQNAEYERQERLRVQDILKRRQEAQELEESHRREERDLREMQLRDKEALEQQQLEEKRLARDAQRRENRDNDEEFENQQLDEKCARAIRKRDQLVENARKATMNYHRPLQFDSESKRITVPVDVLVDFSDDKEAVKQVLKNTEIYGNGNTEHKDKGDYYDRSSKPSRNQHQSSKNLPSSSESGNDLKELQDVAFDFHLNQNRYLHNPSQIETRTVEENVRNLEEISNKVNQVREKNNRRSFSQTQRLTNSKFPSEDTDPSHIGTTSSAFATYMASSAPVMKREQGEESENDKLKRAKGNGISETGLNGNDFKFMGSRQSLKNDTSGSGSSLSSSTSNFKGLKKRQDFPDSSQPTLNLTSSINSERRGTSTSAKTDTESEPRVRVDYKPKYLVKSKVPIGSESEEFEANVPGSIVPPIERGTDILAPPAGHYDYNYVTNLKEKNKNVSDKDFQFSNHSVAVEHTKKISPTSTTTKSFAKWDCPHCTFINKINPLVCEVCSKSKDYVCQESPPDSSTEDTYASVTRNNPNTLLPVVPVLTLRSRDIPKNLEEFPPLQSSASLHRLSFDKFRNGFPLDEDKQDNGNGNVDENQTSLWICPDCTFENYGPGRKCKICN